jgi:D-glycero-D-manno-heptose 1,7-bisphosphate phosphatase
MGKGMSDCVQPAIFLDRDGTMIEDVGFIDDPAKIELYPWTVNALRALQERFGLFVVTNQSAVASGGLTKRQVDQVNHGLDSVLADAGIRIRQWCVCPHAKGAGCGCHKPENGLLLQASENWDIDFQRSFIIGDHPHDALTGKDLGVTGLYLLSGHGEKHRRELPPGVPVFEHLGEATEWILKSCIPSLFKIRY